jgi:uncharacterized Ntn-hydrolase superfamily protein
MTFSLVARCARTGQFGMVIASSSPAVAARCAHVRASLGAVASQNITDPALGPQVLDRLEHGSSAEAAVRAVIDAHAFAAFRQVMAVDRNGRTHIHSGSHILGTWGEAQGENAAAAGNLLAHDGVPRVMLDAFLTTEGALGNRLMIALTAGLAAGGEAGPVHSAGLKIADALSWPYVDLRVDWSDFPIADLQRCWDIYKPQADAYVQRALRPGDAPSYGVPGER